MFEKERGNELSKKFLHSLSETYGSRLTRTRYDMLQHNHVVQKKGVRVFSFFFPLDVEIGQGGFFFLYFVTPHIMPSGLPHKLQALVST